MRLTSSFVFASGVLLTVFACSSSETTPTPAEPTPDGGSTTSTSGSPDVDATTSSTSSGGSSGKPAEVEYVKTTTIKMQHEGVERSYALSVPLDYVASKKYPVFI